MKKFTDLIIKFNLLFVIIFIKRFVFSIKRLFLYILKAFSWLLFSKEHTNFSFELENNNLVIYECIKKECKKNIITKKVIAKPIER